MFDDCNNFFKRKADERTGRIASFPASRKGFGPALVLSAVRGMQAQVLHHSRVVLSQERRFAAPVGDETRPFGA